MGIFKSLPPKSQWGVGTLKVSAPKNPKGWRMVLFSPPKIRGGGALVFSPLPKCCRGRELSPPPNTAVGVFKPPNHRVSPQNCRVFDVLAGDGGRTLALGLAAGAAPPPTAGPSGPTAGSPPACAVPAPLPAPRRRRKMELPGPGTASSCGPAAAGVRPCSPTAPKHAESPPKCRLRWPQFGARMSFFWGVFFCLIWFPPLLTAKPVLGVF